MKVQHWLPKNAFLDATGKDVLSEPVAQWSSTWFARGTATVSKLRAREEGRAPSVSRAQEVQGARATLELHGAGKRSLLEALLDVNLSEQTRSACDMQILDALATDVVQDLACRLEDFLPETDDDGPDADLRITVSIGRNDLLDLIVPAPSLAPLLKARLGSARPSTRALASRSAALRGTALKARAVLGSADLSLNEVKELGVGDVLVLDRALTEAVELRLPGSNTALIRGKLRRNGSQVSIQL